MDTAPLQPVFRPVVVAAALTAAAALVMAVGWFSVSTTHGRAGVGYGVGVVWGLAMLSLPVLQAGLRRGPQTAASLFMAATGGRMILALSAALLGVVVFQLPTRPTLLAIAGAYLPLLAVEVIFVYRAALGAPHPDPSAHRESPA